ncbi:peptidase C15 [Ureibacillus massiliensis 4400831 = CIP 108448 = CCUG 49529]|uniref:Pyrrolidone-carboxylate peptidase n=1 Tax=Ureibacillus massiliensis 4400831 = CIP 108448 = CCUG 49529 TaxID=1211035 RepID=A0A0A3J629_9BACL|nr:pyroglutamyl-peptidase I [Ureibacillus massiliensis]KGR90628.1 peptidase C15 [Ureibacillus massiliensis 4400831 = CIP 108448 = CCUG 49529]
MKKILLTGFEPFLDYKVNPTMKIVEELNGNSINGHEIVGWILPVDFEQSAKLLLEKIDEVNPDVVVSLGLAGGRYKITPERIAVNVKDGDADNNNHAPQDEFIEEAGDTAYIPTIPVRKITNRLIEEGYPAEISNTAGTYLCNNVMYSALHHAKVNKLSYKSGFIHIPASHELAIQHGKIPSWSHSDLMRAVEISLEVITDEVN